MAKHGIICAVLLVCCVVGSMAKVYTVGDSLGWRTGVDYFHWLEGKTFFVGDALVFNYEKGDSVNEVTAAESYACNAANAKFSDTSGHTIIHLKKAGYYYYISHIPDHCGNRMFFELQVHEAQPGSTANPPIAPYTAQLDSRK